MKVKRQKLTSIAGYTCWQEMKRRCYDPNRDNYKWYGARGVTVCDHWRDSFVNFLADVGRRPSPRHSIDRIDPDKGYEPGNCRWALPRTQLLNRRPHSEPHETITREQALEIASFVRDKGITNRAIALKVGVSQGLVGRVRNGRSYRKYTGIDPLQYYVRREGATA
jgi:hypothetical protein